MNRPQSAHSYRRHLSVVSFALLIALPSGTTLPADETEVLQPGEQVDYAKLAFFPDRWKAKQIDTHLFPWSGKRIVLFTTDDELDGAVMQRIVNRLDAGWQVYEDLTGRKPRRLKQFNGKTTIAAVPDGSLTCGIGCGYVGATGIEVGGFYGNDYPLVQRRPEAFPHYYFYEMGRNYYTFGDRHSCFVTGFAVFMRYVCMDAAKCKDVDQPTRRTIERAEAIFAESDMPFVKGFTMLGGLGEKAPRLRNANGGFIQPSDQPVLYASAMLKLRRDCGGDDWVRRFFRRLAECPPVKPDSADEAIQQSIHWMVAASCAAGRDLSPIFCERWRLPLPKEARDTLAEIEWGKQSVEVATVLKRLAAATGEAE